MLDISIRAETRSNPLPVFELSWHAYRHVLDNAGHAFALFRPFLLIAIPLTILACWLLWPLTQGPYAESFAAQAFLVGALCFMPLPIFAAVGIVWHRFMLRDEEPRGADALRIDERSVNYVTLNIGPLLPLVVLAGLFALPHPTGGETFMIIATIIAALVTIVISLRLGLMLPAVALADPMGLQDAWRMTRSQTIPMIAGTILTLLPAILVPVLLQLPIGDNPTRSAFAIVVALEEVSGALLALVYVAFLSLAYERLVDEAA